MVNKYGHKQSRATRVIPAGEFKARCLKLMDEVRDLGTEIVITKHGRPVARMVPAQAAKAPVFGSMKGTLTILGDVIAPVDVDWESASGGDA